MNGMVAAIISAMVNKPQFSEAIREKIGSAVDTADMEKQLEVLQAQLRQTLGTKPRLEKQMDTLDVSDPYYDRKILDLQRQYDEQYGKIEEIEIQIDDVQSQIVTSGRRKSLVITFISFCWPLMKCMALPVRHSRKSSCGYSLNGLNCSLKNRKMVIGSGILCSISQYR